MEKNRESSISTNSPVYQFAISLQKSSDQFFEEFPNPVWIVDLKGRFVFFNKAAEKLIEYQRDEILGKHFRMLLTLDDLSDGFLFLYQTLNGCYSEHTLFRIRKKGGSTRVVDVMAAPLYFDGKVRAGLAIAQDITGIDFGVSEHISR